MVTKTKRMPAGAPTRRRAVALAAALPLVLAGPAATAQVASDWPAKPVKIVVPYAPGGTSDTLGRLLANQLQTQLKQSFVVENRAGGGGVIGSAQVSKVAPDGYTLVVSGIGSHVIAPVENKTYHPMNDFTHIAMLGGPPIALAVHPSFGVSSARELVEKVQRSKDGLSWGSPGQGTHGHLMGELFAQQAKIAHTHVAYKGAGPAMADLLGGQIPATFTTLTSVNQHIAAGKVRGLAVSAEHRLREYPDIPTFAELGWPQLVGTTWFSISGPPGMPQPLVDRINGEVRKALKAEAIQKQMAVESIESMDLDAAAFTRYVKAEIDRWQPLVKVEKK